MNCRSLVLFFMIVLVYPLAGTTQQVCISQDEQELIDLINDFRKENNLDKIESSVVMNYVADVHSKDLYLNYDISSKYGLHFWSNQGRWSKSGDKEEFLCMYDKPFELTGYRSKGYELVSYYSVDIPVQDILANWKENASASNFLLQKGTYSNKNWMSIGVSVFEGYICVWVGELSDKKGSPKVCDDKEEKKSVISIEEVPIYILIVGSHPTKTLAKKEVSYLKNKGYDNAYYVKAGKSYRIIADRYYGYSASQKAKDKLPRKYKSSWIAKE